MILVFLSFINEMRLTEEDGGSLFINLKYLLLFVLVVMGCQPSSTVGLGQVHLSDKEIALGIPVGFDRSGGIVTWNNDEPEFVNVPTSMPVLYFAGYNSDRNMVAYTSLDLLQEGAEDGRMSISREESFSRRLDDLVPSGQLVIENAETKILYSEDRGEFVVSAHWSPVDANVIAYGYNANSTSGVKIFNIVTGEQIGHVTGNVIPDTFMWSDDGSEIIYYANELGEDDPSIVYDHEMDIPYSAKSFDLATGLVRERMPSLRKGAIRPSFTNENLEISLPRGELKMSRAIGGDDITFDDNSNDSSILFKAEQVRGFNEMGITFVDSQNGTLNLYAFGGNDDEPQLLLSGGGLTYYIPIAAGPNVYFTQVGASYPGGGCNVYTHTSGSSMAYAIDIQISGGSYDEVIASTTGTVSSYVSWVTCNSIDTSGCGIYSGSCSSNGGWGNVVILAHSDGYYTKYTHLEHGSHFQVSSTGSTAYTGCWLADEGGTGASSGNKNGCGDHVHFQRQNSSSQSGTSVSVSFAEDGYISSSDCTTKTPVYGGSSCSL